MKKILCSILASALIVSCAALPAFASDYQDKQWHVRAEDNDGGTPHYTNFRSKEDDTSSYVSSWSSNKSNLFCWVIRSHNQNSYSGDVTDRYYGHHTYNGASQNQRRIAPGNYAYLANYVNEDHYAFAGIGFTMQREHVIYDFYWSPDSI